MDMRELDRQIKAGEIKNFCFFCGEEQFLIDNKLKSIKKHFVDGEFSDMNYVCFEGKDNNVDNIITEIETFPMMSDRKLIVLKNTGILSNSKLTEYKRFKAYIPQIPDYTIVVMVEGAIDKKKLKNYDWINEVGAFVDFKRLTMRELEVWLEKWFDSIGKRILDRDISYFIRMVGTDMSILYNETIKLIEYTTGRDKITRTDIDRVAIKSTEFVVFDMIDDIIENRTSRVMEALMLFKERKESATVILSLMTTRLAEILMVKEMRGVGIPSNEAAKYFDTPRPTFVVNKLYEQSRAFGDRYLKRMIKKGLDYDLQIKSGRLSDWNAVTLFVGELVKK